MRRLYIPKNFQRATVEIIDAANHILREYAAQGFDLTLRQLYYQFVARDMLANSQRSYDRLGGIINDARLAGKIDWGYIVDRTRNVQEWASWESPSEAARQAASRYRRDRWEDQPYYVEVWVEKDALAGVIERPCSELMVPFFSCRGYTSQSEMWSAAQRLYAQAGMGKRVKILHLGDHDPSGIDMSRDIRERLQLFMGVDYHYDTEIANNTAIWRWLDETLTVDRIALTMDQVEEHDPPPNPAKLTDSRADDYIRKYGMQSWELDALSPTELARLITDSVKAIRDEDLWEDVLQQEKKERDLMMKAAEEWED